MTGSFPLLLSPTENGLRIFFVIFLTTFISMVIAQESAGQGLANPRQFVGSEGTCQGTKNGASFQGSQYLGCFNWFSSYRPGPGGTAAPAVSPSPTNLFPIAINTSPASPAYYPAWRAAPDYNANSYTLQNCTTACRGHGYMYAALHGSNICECGTYAPYNISSLSTIHQADPSSLNICYSSYCHSNSSQLSCGYAKNSTVQYADVYVDNSFPLPGSLTVTQQSSYSYVGCFSGAVMAAMAYGDLGVTSGYSTLAACFRFCGSYGYPITAFGFPSLFGLINGPLGTACYCGTEVQSSTSYVVVQITDSQCDNVCDTSSGCNAITGGAGCCGGGNGFSVYMNLNLLGCYSPPFTGPPNYNYTLPPGSPAVVNKVTTANYAGNEFVVATNPPSPPIYILGQNVRYSLLGCYARSNSSTPIFSGAVYNSAAMTVEMCFSLCSSL